METERAKRHWLALRFAVTCLCSKGAIASRKLDMLAAQALVTLDWGPDPKLRQERILRETGWVPSAMAWHWNSSELAAALHPVALLHLAFPQPGKASQQHLCQQSRMCGVGGLLDRKFVLQCLHY